MSFTISLQSYYTSGSNHQNCDYTFDFADAGDVSYKGKYKLSYSFLSQTGLTVTDDQTLKYITINGLSSAQSYKPQYPAGSGNLLCQNLGNLRFDKTNTSYITRFNEQAPIILNSKPNTNTINIKILDQYGNADTIFTNSINYFLTLYFEKYEE